MRVEIKPEPVKQPTLRLKDVVGTEGMYLDTYNDIWILRDGVNHQFNICIRGDSNGWFSCTPDQIKGSFSEIPVVPFHGSVMFHSE